MLYTNKNRLNRLLIVCAISCLFVLISGCATRLVDGPYAGRGSVTVYPMHGDSVHPTMIDVARIQRAGDGFLLMYVDNVMVPSDGIDYVEVMPGKRRLVLVPGREMMFSWERSEQVYFLSLDTKPNAWYIFRCQISEEGPVVSVEVQGRLKITKKEVIYSLFEAIEVHNGLSTIVATTRDFVPFD